MKSILNYLAVVFSFLFCLSWFSCSDDDSETAGPPSGNSSIQLSVSEYSADPKGGWAEVPFTVLHPEYGEPEVLLDCNADWIDGLSVLDHKIIFEVRANKDKEDRQAEIQIRVKNVAQGLKLRVFQEKMDNQSGDENFSVESGNAESNKACFVINPRNSNQQFLAFCLDRYTLLNNTRTDEHILKFFLEKMGRHAENQPLEQVLAPYLYQGSQSSVELDNLMPYMDYTLILVGVEFTDHDCKPVTPLAKVDFTTAALPENGVAHFDLSVNSPTATANMKLVTDYEGKYYWGCLPVGAQGEWSESEMLKELVTAREDAMYAGNSLEGLGNVYGYSEHELSEHRICKAGERYCFYAYAIDDEAMIISPITKCFFTAGPAVPSDNVIHIEATDIDNWSASVVIVPSKEESFAYAAHMTTGFEKDFDDMSDEEIINMMLEDREHMYCVDHFTSFGVFDSSIHGSNEINVFAFGFDGENVTGNLVRYKFNFLKSGEVPHSDNVITFSINEVTDTTVDFDIHTTTWDTYMVGYAPTSLLQGMSDEDIFKWMYEEHHYKYYTRGDKEHHGWTQLEPSTSYTVIAFCQHDDSPMTSPVFTQEFTTKPKVE